MMRFLNVAAFILAPAALAQHPVAEIKVAGNARLPAAAVIAASGLRVGQIATRAQFDAAAQRLADTGFFASVSYGYDPKTVGGVSGYALTLHVSEQTTLAPVELDIPGLDVEELWQRLKSADPLIDRQMPNNDRALAYYQRALERELGKLNYTDEIVMKNEVDLRTGRMMTICRPAHPPKIAAIRFEGNAAIADSTLQASMTKVAMGQDYSERDFRRMLELNVRPLYEDLGHLTVTITSVNMARAGDAVTVTAAIDEGPAWRLGKVILTGEALPLADMHEAARFAYGSPANWKQFMAAVHDMEQVLRRDGYIRVSSKPVRSFHASAQVMDVNVEFTKGPQFLFGELHIDGLDAVTQQRLAGLWKLPGGAPMNQPYIDDFVRSAMSLLRGKFRTFSSDLHVRTGTHVVDVTLKFR
jgi:outer membrane protein assembly factor BamA